MNLNISALQQALTNFIKSKTSGGQSQGLLSPVPDSQLGNSPNTTQMRNGSGMRPLPTPTPSPSPTLHPNAQRGWIQTGPDKWYIPNTDGRPNPTPWPGAAQPKASPWPSTTPNPQVLGTQSTPSALNQAIQAQQLSSPEATVAAIMGRTEKFKRDSKNVQPYRINNLVQVAKEYGINPQLFLDVHAQESSFINNPEPVIDKYGRAHYGPYQFDANTWNTGRARYKNLNLPEFNRENASNPQYAVPLAAAFMKDKEGGRWIDSLQHFAELYPESTVSQIVGPKNMELLKALMKSRGASFNPNLTQ